MLVASQTMTLTHCEIQDKRGLCTDLQLSSLLFCGALNFKVTLLNKCIWLLGSRKHQPTQTAQVSPVLSVEEYICVYCAISSCS